jgi:hypothetical protein
VKTRRSFVALVLLFALLPATAVAKKKKGAITGHVVDAKGQGLEGATVVIGGGDDDIGALITTAEGFFSQELLDPGKYSLVVYWADAKVTCESITVTAGAKVTLRIPIPDGDASVKLDCTEK